MCHGNLKNRDTLGESVIMEMVRRSQWITVGQKQLCKANLSPVCMLRGDQLLCGIDHISQTLSLITDANSHCIYAAVACVGTDK